MSDAVVVGLIAGVVSIIGNIFVFASKTRETNATMAAHEQKQQDALDAVKLEMQEVKKRLDIHNGYAEKIGGIQKDIAVIKTDLSYLKQDK